MIARNYHVFPPVAFSFCFTSGGDGFTATVYDHGINAGYLKKYNVAHDLAH